MANMNLGSNQRVSGRSYLDGQCLIAMPGMSDQRFARSVVYLCAHSEDGAMGIIVNKPAADTRFPELLVQLDVIPPDQAIRLPTQAEKVKVLRGGPVETKRGFVLHSADFFLESATLPIDDGICLTATLDILRAIAVGTGPESAVLALGYAGWGAGQLESEIQSNGWLHCPADQALLFDDALDTKYTRALGKLGIDPAFLSKDAGHA
ncbi:MULTISPECIES: YqgE/AlgH family protein [unclassified Bosea (in: a-proteobacteria)]|uniref:YqgE/AlgH family protein n=1 Tax=unclassified Bosea (in: a-proteobacteria) TaxID=2653178 RepID=UPI000F7DC4FE|nr:MULTISPECIES: YqgE/AlgH family protein [unclassified Bosea (in: a-proteobacteria)]